MGKGEKLLRVFKDSHYAAETTTSLHHDQIRIVFGGALCDDCDEAFEDWERARNYLRLTNSSSKDNYQNVSIQSGDTSNLLEAYW
jgi:hypothetical protein